MSGGWIRPRANGTHMVLARVGGRERSFGTYRRRIDAQRRLIEVQHSLMQGIVPDVGAGKVPLSQWVREVRGARALAPSTRVIDESLICNHVDGTLGRLPIAAIDPASLSRWLNSLQSSPATIHKVFGYVDQALRRAVALGILPRNPADVIRGDLPAAPPRKALEVPSLGDIERLADATDPRYAGMVALAGFGGLRYGEIAALEPGDIRNGAVHVSKALDRLGNIVKPKTPAGVRVVSLPRRALDRILPAVGRTYLFTAPRGESLRYGNWRARFWIPATRRVGLEGLGFHQLRHAHASHLVAAGVDVLAVAARLGHSQPSVTLNTYGHALDQGERIAQILDADNALTREDMAL